jgi:hypothetical protein
MNKQKIELINDFLDNIVKNIHQNFRITLYELLLNNIDSIKCNNHCRTIIYKTYKFPATGIHTKGYWLARGWSVSESTYNAKKHNKHTGHSPFSLEFWLDKINPNTNELYTKIEADYKRNSQRPIRKEYYLELGYGEEEAIELAKQTKDTNNKSGAKSSGNRPIDECKGRSPRCKEYYLIRGFSEEEATEKISDVQTTFSLDICIEKYGLEEGTRVWQDRQDNWQATLNSKSEEEIGEINRKKSNAMSYGKLWTNATNMDGIFYLLDLYDGFYKIGITTSTVKSRYYTSHKDYKLLFEYSSSINHCFQIEQLLKNIYLKDKKIDKIEEILGFGWTETFKDIDLILTLNIINDLVSDEEQTTRLFKSNFNLKYEQNF